MSARPRSTIAFASNDSRASTSVEILPGISLRISIPTKTASRSQARSSCSWFDVPRDNPNCFAASTKGAYCGIAAALSNSDGFVVASCGLNCFIASMSPVSATTSVIVFNCSSLLGIPMILYWRMGDDIDSRRFARILQ